MIIVPAIVTMVWIGGCRIPAARDAQVEASERSLAPPPALSGFIFSGTPLSGPLPTPIDSIDPATSFVVEVTAVAIPTNLTNDSEPLGRHIRLLSATRGGQPVRATSALVRDAQFLPRALADQVGTLRGPAIRHIVTAGATTSFLMTESTDRVVTLSLSRSAAGSNVEVALSIQGLVAPPAARDDSAATQPVSQSVPAAVLETELAILEPVHPNQLPIFVIIVPADAQTWTNSSLALEVKLSPAANDVDAQALLADAAAALKTSVDVASKVPTTPTLKIDTSDSFSAAVFSLIFPERRRAALAYLAQQSGAAITADVALVAGDAAIQALCEKIITQTLVAGVIVPQDQMGWFLEKQSLESLVGKLSTQIEPELAALLTIHAGQAGRSASSMDTILKAAANNEDLDARLIAENWIYLEDSSPAARVRAFDWLTARGRAPKDFNPLGPAKIRRAALDKALAELSNAAP